MNVTQRTRRRRARRLGIALCLALLCHLGLIVSSNWGLALIAVPSKEDRVIALSLDHSSPDGVAEPNKEVNETIDTDIGKPNKNAPQPPTINPQKNQTETQAPVQGPIQVPIADIAELKKSDAEALVETTAEVAEVEDIADSATAKNNSTQSITPPSQPETTDAGALDTSASSKNEFITANSNILPIQIEQAVDTAPLEDTNKPPLVSQELVEIEPKQQKKIEKKLARILAKSNDAEDLTNPVSWTSRDQSYTASFEYIKADNEMGIDEVRVEVTTEQDGEQLSTSLRYKKLVFSNFAQFVDQWNEHTMIHDDQMDGRFHSNTKFNISGSHSVKPVFYGRVTTAASGFNRQGVVPRKKIFLGGLETSVKKIAMPKPQALFSETQQTQVETIFIEQDSRLRFFADGSLLRYLVKRAGPPQRHIIGDQPTYLLASPKTKVYVSGDVNGLVTVFAPRRLLIDGPIRYASRAPIDQGGDFLGLVSGQNVLVAGRDHIDDGDLNIDASIYARGRFGINQIRGKRSGVLNLFGSLSVGTLTATEPRYATKIMFDPRLENLRPPGFPVTDRYELLARDRNWTLAESPFLSLQDDE